LADFAKRSEERLFKEEEKKTIHSDFHCYVAAEKRLIHFYFDGGFSEGLTNQVVR